MKCLLKLSTFIPEGKLTSPNAVADWFFGANTASEKQLLRDILKDTDPAFFKWAINEIIHWENETMPAHSIHIHGNKDRIIPIKNVKADYVIEGGGHLMTVNKAAEVEHIIRSVFKNE